MGEQVTVAGVVISRDQYDRLRAILGEGWDKDHWMVPDPSKLDGVSDPVLRQALAIHMGELLSQTFLMECLAEKNTWPGYMALDMLTEP